MTALERFNAGEWVAVAEAVLEPAIVGVAVVYSTALDAVISYDGARRLGLLVERD